MSTTFQGRGPVRIPRGGSERRSLRDTIADRLAGIGASPDEIDDFRATWDESPPSPDEVEWARHVSDAELAHELRKTRAEYDEATTVDGDESATGGAPDEGSSSSSVELPEDVVRVADIIDWVGGDPDRARSALEVEYGRSTQRSTLVETLEMILRASAV